MYAVVAIDLIQFARLRRLGLRPPCTTQSS